MNANITMAFIYNTGHRYLQERFVTDLGISDEILKTASWWIPITVRGQCDDEFTRTVTWMSPQETSKVIAGVPRRREWIILNVGQMAPYRVNYSGSNWRRLIKQLKNDALRVDTLDRMKMLTDAFQLARAGKTNANRTDYYNAGL